MRAYTGNCQPTGCPTVDNAQTLYAQPEKCVSVASEDVRRLTWVDQLDVVQRVASGMSRWIGVIFEPAHSWGMHGC